ncbi:NAD-dependent epimerase/dehydratase domain-containing protein [Pararobbsia alpina]|uniref:SDR family oxidoreductase n=1 Tax=Pararobbsia alpina TaxID=621374 RepID=UPI0039A766F9
MKVLVCGANGFIGQALCTALMNRGHRVIKGVRDSRQTDEMAMDFTTDVEPGDWASRLCGVDIVINAVGILVERNGQTFDRIHHRAPAALFEAAAHAGVKRIVQISALGAQTGSTAYFESKRRADESLRALPVDHAVLRPALVYGVSGASSRFFRTIAALPVHPLPDGGHQTVRPIHIDDLADVVVTLVDSDRSHRGVHDLVGATELAYRDMLATYRASMGMSRAWRVDIPKWMIDLSASLGDRLPGSMLTRDTWHMLQQGNTGDVAATASLLGHLPAGIESFVSSSEAGSLRSDALDVWRMMCLRIALAIVWLGTAICCAWIYPHADSLALLERVHVTGVTALGLLYASICVDAVLGVLTLVRPGKRLWWAQASLIAMYSVIVAFALPEYLYHPFGPILKNAPILASLAVLSMEETRS